MVQVGSSLRDLYKASEADAVKYSTVDERFEHLLNYLLQYEFSHLYYPSLFSDIYSGNTYILHKYYPGTIFIGIDENGHLNYLILDKDGYTFTPPLCEDWSLSFVDSCETDYDFVSDENILNILRAMLSNIDDRLRRAGLLVGSPRV